MKSEKSPPAVIIGSTVGVGLTGDGKSPHLLIVLLLVGLHTSIGVHYSNLYVLCTVHTYRAAAILHVPSANVLRDVKTFSNQPPPYPPPPRQKKNKIK